MNAETFLEQFETFAEAPNGVEALREMILQLAVQGKLLPQDPNDEPATTLRREMESARQQLIERGEIRTGDTFDAVTQEEAPYQLPCNWEWARVGEVMHLINGKAFKPTDWQTSGLPIVRIQNLNNPDAPFNYSSDDVEDKVRLTTGDFLISWSGTPGTSFGAFIWDRGPAVLNQHIFRAILFGNAYTKPFLRIAVNARLDEMIAQAHGGVGLQHITKGKLERLSLPLPPLAEQKRIVAKVDQLLALCDEMAARQEARRVARTQLVGATLDRLVSTRSAADLPPHVNRLQTHFDHLFDTPTTIPQLRQTILQLAVQGQLVPQDPNDEPAAISVSRAEKKRQGLIANGELREDRTLVSPPIESGDDIPPGWCNVRIGHITNCLDHIRKPVSKAERELLTGEASIPYYGANGQVGWIDQHIFDEDLVLVVEDESFIGRVKPFSYRVSGKCWVNNHAHVLQPMSSIDPDYLNTALSYYPFTPLTSGTTNRKKLTKVGLLNAPLCIPPLAEQKRIVAKVTELLSLCDTLEAQLQTAESASSQLLSAAVHHLLRSEAPAVLES